MASSTISNVSTTATPSAVSSNSKNLTSKEIVIVMGSIALGLLLILLLIFVFALRRRRHQQKYEKADDSKSVGASESSELQETFALGPSNHHSMFKRAEADPLITSYSESQYLKDSYTRSSSSINKYDAGLATHEAHIISLPVDVAQSPKNNAGFETTTTTFQYNQPSSSKSTIKLAPLSIPTKFPNNSNGNLNRSNNKRTLSRKSSKPPDSGWDSDDSASLYSVASASASASAYFSKVESSLENIRPPPVPPLPVFFASPNLSTLSLPRGTDITVIAPNPNDEEIITTKSLPALPLLSLAPPSLRVNGEEEDETETLNVAKLLQSRSSKLPMVPRDAMSRNASIVSHIERQGSITVVIASESTTDSDELEESYRPRYINRLKQKTDSNNKDSFSSSNLSNDISDSLSIPNPWPLAPNSSPSPQLGSS